TICLSVRRDRTVLCVVEEPLDVLAIERTGEYHGLYHVLHGALSPIDGVGPEELKIGELLRRLAREPVMEVILATDSDMEGEATESRRSRPAGCTRTWRRTSSSGCRNTGSRFSMGV